MENNKEKLLILDEWIYYEENFLIIIIKMKIKNMRKMRKKINFLFYFSVYICMFYIMP